MCSKFFVLLVLVGAAIGLPDYNKAIKKVKIKPNSNGVVEGLGIYDGKKTNIKKHPYVVALWLRDDLLLGSGTIVSNSWVVTSARVIDTDYATYINVVAGASNGYSGVWYQPAQTVLHPKYKSERLDYNYGLIQINGNFKWSAKIQPLPLATIQAVANTKMNVAGFGGTTSSSGESPSMMEGTMTWMSDEECKTVVKQHSETWTKRIACVQNQGGTTLCEGDDGNGFVQNGSFYGLMSYLGADSCDQTADPVILASIPPVASWIKNITGASFDYEVVLHKQM